jgi:hypothetical protein
MEALLPMFKGKVQEKPFANLEAGNLEVCQYDI